MSKFVYKDFIPANARIIVDYKAKEKVKFSYPKKRTYWNAVWKQAFPTIQNLWAKIFLMPIVYFFLFGVIPFYVISYIIMSISEGSLVKNPTSESIVITLIFLFFIFGIPAILTFFLALNPDRLANWVPKCGYWASMLSCSKKEIIFTPKDVFDNKVMIPSFSNVFLDYKCFGDFNKRLEKVEILEHPFDYTYRSRWFPFSKKKSRNEFDFRAVFYFSGEIKTGKIMVNFI